MSGSALGAPRSTVAGQLCFQAEACGYLGSPLYAGLLRRAAEDVEAGGPSWEVLRGHERDPEGSMLALRLMGAVNRLVLAGEEPALARVYRDRDSDPSVAWREFAAVLGRNSGALRGLVELPVQTNEVGRSAGMLPGFLAVAAEAGLPLRLLEIGASAGLNLRWDRYRYVGGEFAWGPAGSPVEIDFELRGKARSSGPPVEIAERGGCDISPIDPTTPQGRLTLLAYVWPDQRKRIERMEAALGVAADVPVSIDRDGAASWVERKLSEVSPGRATVVFHSIVIQYLGEEEQTAFCGHVRAAAERATPDAPLAWLRMEPAGEWADVRLTTWPAGEDRHLARVGYHGNFVELV